MNQRVLVFFLIMFLIGTDTFLVSPLLPVLKEHFRISTEQSGWIVSAYAIGYAVFALLAGALSDSMDRKKVLIAGFGGFMISTIFCGFANTYWEMLLFRFAAGISAAFVTPQIWAAIPGIAKPGSTFKAFGFVAAGLSVSQVVGVPFGSMLGEKDWQMPFYIIGALSFVLLIWLLGALPSIPGQKQKIGIFKRYSSLLNKNAAKVSFLSYFIFQTGNFSAFAFIGSFFAYTFSFDLSKIGVLMIFLGIANFIGSSVSGRLVQKIGAYKTVQFALSAIILSYGSLVFFHSSFSGAFGAFLLIFFFGGTVFPVLMNSLQGLAPESRGTISGLANSIMYFGTAAGSSMAGKLFSARSGFSGIALFAAVCFILSYFLFQKSIFADSRNKASVIYPVKEMERVKH